MWNQKLFKKNIPIKVATMKITDDFHGEWKPTTNRHFCCEWDTKEGTCKSIKNALYVHQYGKRHLSG